jgi:hypothetical protein
MKSRRFMCSLNARITRYHIVVGKPALTIKKE